MNHPLTVALALVTSVAAAEPGLVVLAGDTIGDSEGPGVAAALHELERRGWVTTAPPELRSLAGSRIAALSPADRAAAHAELELGFTQWLAGKLAAAEATLARGLARVDGHTAALIDVAPLRNQVFRAEVVLALIADRRGDSSSAITRLASLAVHFPDRPVDHESYGPRAAELYAAAFAASRELDRGTIAVEAASADAIFLDFRRIGTDRAVVQTTTGSHEVHIVSKGQLTARASVDVMAAARVRVVLDTTVARALVRGDRRARLHGLTDAEVVHVALRLLRDAGLASVIVVAARNGSLSIRRYAEDGDLIASATTSSANAAGARDAAGIVGADDRLAESHQSAPSTTIPWALAAVGGVAATTGLVLLAIDGRGACAEDTCPEVYDTRSAGLLTLGGGVAVAAAGLIWAGLSAPEQPAIGQEPR